MRNCMRPSLPWIVVALLSAVAVPLSAGPAWSAEAGRVDVVVWTVTLPDGQVIRLPAREGAESKVDFRHGDYPYWLTLRAGVIDPATGTAWFELAKGAGPERTSEVATVLESRSIEPFTKAVVPVDLGFDVSLEIQEVRKARAADFHRTAETCGAQERAKGGDNCCVTCGSTTACGCGVCMSCGSCCNTGCFCPVCDG